MLKTSRYDFFFQLDDSIILAYNSLSQRLAELAADEFSALQDFQEAPVEDFFEARGLTSFRDDLVSAGFLIPDAESELEKLRTTHAEMKARKQGIGLTIVPTLDCNFRCIYCFSYARPQRMGEDVQDALIRFVEARLAENPGLAITWYGGEPTLCLDIIERLSERLKKLCEQNQAKFYPGNIVTNGYLLSEKVARRLKDAGIESAQVTLDGDQETHDARRPLANGMGTFIRILKNVAAARELLKIQIRINIDRTNVSNAIAALDVMRANGLQGIPTYFGHVQAYTDACASISSECLSEKEFGELNLDLTRQALVRGFPSLSMPHLQLGGVCGADREMSYLIAPDGLLFKCWSQASLGIKESIGNIFDRNPSPEQKINNQRYLDWDPFADPTCQDCGVLPICMGGCPYMRLFGPPGSNCAPWRHFLLETLALDFKLKRLTREQAPGVH